MIIKNRLLRHCAKEKGNNDQQMNFEKSLFQRGSAQRKMLLMRRNNFWKVCCAVDIQFWSFSVYIRIIIDFIKNASDFQFSKDFQIDKQIIDRFGEEILERN